MSLRVLVVEDDPLARAGLASLIRMAGLTLAAEAASSDDLPALASASRADAAACDLGMRSEAMLEAVAALSAGGLPVLALASDDAQAGQAIAAGARAALAREADAERLAAALQAVVHGLLVIDGDFAGALVARRLSLAAPGLVESLTPRESEVLQLLAQGLSNKEIARRLDITDSTAKFHVTAILGKLGAENRSEAIVTAARLGLVVL